MSKENLPKELKAIAQQMSAAGLRQRDSQMEMLKSVYDAIQNQDVLCIEAPTGTGKTLAYCLGALKARKESQVIIISTATTALQEQFFQKDLLLIEKILGEKLNVVVSKGRRRYVCQARLFNPEEYMEVGEQGHELLKLQGLLSNGIWDGELDKLAIKIEPELWQNISTDKSGCSAGRCEYFNECTFYQNRRKMAQADMIVTNHSLLLSDLELGGGVILPDMEGSVYVIDECHHLPEKALSHFAKQAALMRSLDWINNISKTMSKAVLFIKMQQQTTDNLHLYIKNLVEELRQARQLLDASADQFSEKQWRLVQLESPLFEIAKNLATNAGSILTVLKNTLRLLDDAFEQQVAVDKLKADAITHLQSSMNFIVDRCENLVMTWHDLFELNDPSRQVPMACWFEKVDTRDGGDYTLHTSPINVSAAMRELFWDKVKNGVVLCSATIRALGKFNDFFRRMGLKENQRIIEKALKTPFEHQHSVLYVPRMLAEPTPQQQDQHLDEMLSLLPKLILEKSGNLVLFTSRRAMDYVYKLLPDSMKLHVLLQNNASKQELIKQHKEKVDRQQCSIIFGLASFAEGIDLPGQYCQHVIIQKIPFSVPSDPIAQTRSEWLKKHQADPFQLVTLPETSIKLTQYIGRLLRHEDDRGVVTILDKRLYTKNYGKSLLNNLPGFTSLVNISVDEFHGHATVQAFYS